MKIYIYLIRERIFKVAYFTLPRLYFINVFCIVLVKCFNKPLKMHLNFPKYYYIYHLYSLGATSTAPDFC